MSEAVYVFTYFLFTCFTLFFFFCLLFFTLTEFLHEQVYMGAGGGCLRASVCVCVREGERE